MRQLLTQNVLRYPEQLETAGILRSACCFYIISADNNVIILFRVAKYAQDHDMLVSSINTKKSKQSM